MQVGWVFGCFHRDGGSGGLGAASAVVGDVQILASALALAQFCVGRDGFAQC